MKRALDGFRAGVGGALGKFMAGQLKCLSLYARQGVQHGAASLLAKAR